MRKHRSQKVKPQRAHRLEFDLKCGKFCLKLGKKTLIMGILNVTPDSFSDGGVYFKKGDALKRACQMEEEGADIIDIGGESSRPYSESVSIKEELKRVIPVIGKLAKRLKIPISVDTCKSEVARCALEEGASLVNDITALRHDNKLVEIVKKYDVPLVIMHMRGLPRDMQDNPEYKDVVSDIIEFLRERIEFLKAKGIKEERLVVDPGIGFGKTKTDNLEILRRLDEFKVLKRPMLIGTSRKSFIGKVLDLNVNERIFGTAATVTFSIIKGAHIVRVHDVRVMREVSRMTDAILNLN
jgi:dihydropteroate synthase